MSGSVLAFYLQTPDLTPASGILVAASLLIGLGNDRRDREMVAGGVNGDKREVSRAHVLAMILNVILHPDFHSDFHRSAVYTIHRGAKDYQVADVHWDSEIKMIDGSSHHVVARMAVRGHGGGKINPVHEASAQESAQHVRIVGQNDFSHF